MRANDPKATVVLEYYDIPDEIPYQGQICPSCHGGPSQETSFTVTRRGEFLLYICHRASCGFQGRVFAASNGQRRSRPTEKSRIEIEETPLNQATIKFLSTKYRVPRETLEAADLGWTGDGLGTYARRVSFPILGPDSKQRGTSYRSYTGAKPKSLIELRDNTGPAMAWYKHLRVSDVLVIVEDQMSALRIAPHYHAVALLGTHISEAKMEEIKAGKYDVIYLSLDPDAISTAVKLQLHWSRDLPNMRIMGMPCDVKDMDEEQFKDYLDRLYGLPF